MILKLGLHRHVETDFGMGERGSRTIASARRALCVCRVQPMDIKCQHTLLACLPRCDAQRVDRPTDWRRGASPSDVTVGQSRGLRRGGGSGVGFRLCRGTSLIRNTHPSRTNQRSLGIATVWSYGGGVSHERGTPVGCGAYPENQTKFKLRFLEKVQV